MGDDVPGDWSWIQGSRCHLDLNRTISMKLNASMEKPKLAQIIFSVLRPCLPWSSSSAALTIIYCQIRTLHTNFQCPNILDADALRRHNLSGLSSTANPPWLNFQESDKRSIQKDLRPNRVNSHQLVCGTASKLRREPLSDPQMIKMFRFFASPFLATQRRPYMTHN